MKRSFYARHLPVETRKSVYFKNADSQESENTETGLNIGIRMTPLCSVVEWRYKVLRFTCAHGVNRADDVTVSVSIRFPVFGDADKKKRF